MVSTKTGVEFSGHWSAAVFARENLRHKPPGCLEGIILHSRDDYKTRKQKHLPSASSDPAIDRFSGVLFKTNLRKQV